ncbi:hypothetical protein WOLCODRAFT_15461 [Wolfiporia cocos MD-104 SS10]|uniref:Uncharacterized protein n=1 Tax=Wolfiporia cocos (strain MD-104) TaxID=742152 RepID=A0A2H3J839_WOLCO|nr:hypothetical protein WOLCODRAFT_15461 [Wolfiporia cocos MD-104 SS10]
MSDIQSLLSCFLVSTLIVFVSACYGVTIAQTIFYFHRYRDDSTTLKSFVCSVFDSVKMLSTCGVGSSMDTSITMSHTESIIMQILWKYLVYGHDDYIQLTHWPTEEQLVWTFSCLSELMTGNYDLRDLIILFCRYMEAYLSSSWLQISPSGDSSWISQMFMKALCAITTLVIYCAERPGAIDSCRYRYRQAPARLQSAMELVTNVYITAALMVILRKFKTRGQTIPLVIKGGASYELLGKQIQQFKTMFQASCPDVPVPTIQQFAEYHGIINPVAPVHPQPSTREPLAPAIQPNLELHAEVANLQNESNELKAVSTRRDDDEKGTDGEDEDEHVRWSRNTSRRAERHQEAVGDGVVSEEDSQSENDEENGGTDPKLHFGFEKDVAADANAQIITHINPETCTLKHANVKFTMRDIEELLKTRFRTYKKAYQ